MNTPVSSPLSDLDRERVLYRFNDTDVLFSSGVLVHELFEAQAQRTPAVAAVRYGEVSITYAELNRRADSIALQLRRRGVGAGQIVGIFVQRAPEMIVGLIAVLKAGAAYAPLDPGYPPERLKHMLDDAAPSVVLTQSPLQALLPPTNAEIVLLDQPCQTTPLVHDTAARSACEPNAQLVYVIYTSGSTGTPKGTLMPHSAMINLLEWHSRALPLSIGTRVLQFAALSFDVAFQETFSTLCGGGTLVLLDERIRRDPQALVELMKRESIERLFVPPLMLQSLAEYVCMTGQFPRALKDVITAGEQLRVTPHIVSLFKELPGARLHNHYGPTETHVVTALTLEGVPDQWPVLPSIGRPIANTQIYLLDEQRQPVPVGVPGEIFIGGANIALGYWRRPQLTSERFVPDPIRDPAMRMYKTGDLARWCEDGTIEYLGRNDFQVKIRGYRIELGEVEAVLEQEESVKAAALFAHDDGAGQKRLVAYVVPRHRPTTETAFLESVRAFAKARLPEHMVPSAFVGLEELPLTPNGKIDRKALPAPKLGVDAGRHYEVPQGKEEALLAGIWQDLLHVERIGRDDDFFELGGHSLLVVQMMERLRRAGYSAEANEIFINPMLADFARMMKQGVVDGGAAPPNLIPADCKALKPEMLPLVTLSAEELLAVCASVPGGGANIQDIYPLTPLQEGMLFHRLLEPDGGDIYVQALLVSLPSRQRLDAFVHAIQAVTARHDVLRTAFAWEGLRQPVQVVCRAAAVPVEELSLDPQTNAMAQMRKRMVAESMRIDLRAAPLMSLQIAADPRQQVCYALLKFHHAIHDHVSLEIMLEEVAWFMTGRAGELPEPAHFRAHVAQIGVYAKERDAESFFRGKLSDVSEPTAPFGLLEVRDGTQDLREARQRLDSALARRIRNQAWNLRVAAATLFHAAWAIVVARTAARDDIVFGSVLSGRLGGTAGGQRTLGMFINTLPVRLRLAELSVHELVQTTRREIMELLGHELASLAIAQRCSGLSGASLFSTVLNYRHTATDPEIGIVGKIVDLELLEFRQRTSYPVTLSVDDWGNEFALSAQSHPSIDPQRLIDYMTVALQSLVSALESAPDTRALALEIVGEQERRTLVRDFNATHTNYPRDALVHELFEQQTMQSPRVIAARWEDCSVTYDELNRRANQWAQWLIKRGVRPGECVPVAIPRSIESLVVQLALLKCGGVYVPIDSSLPLDRQQFMIGDCHASRMVRAPDDSASRPAISSLDVIDYAASSDAVHEQAEENLNLHLSALDPAYIMYTSGSTGAPKGVVVPHRAINRLVCNNTYARVEPTDRVSHCSNPAFDAATFEIWGALLNGATLVIVPQTVLLEPKHFAQLMLSERVTVLWITIGLLNQYVEELREVFPQLRYLITGGDVVDAETVRRVQRRGPQHFLNAYGPTECTTFSTIYEIGAADEVQPRIPIGKPVSNGQVYIVDAHLRPVPVAVVGEIFVGGDGVALEYLGRPDLTRERFVADPFSAVTGARLYRTGDLGRWRADGNIEFLGRNDQQVKFRGFRIELGEIEAHLMREEGIREAVVVARLDSHGKRLVAYLTLQSGRACSTENLRAALGKHLPEYMIPSAFVVLDAIPLTPNGKVDRRALPEPGTRAYASRGYEAPRNEAEHMLAEIWKDVLGLDRVGRQDHFFELGGHSLLAMQVVTRVRAAHSVEIPVKWLFESPTLAALAMRLAACRRENLIGWVSAGGEEMEELIRQISSMSEQDVGKRIEEMMGGRP